MQGSCTNPPVKEKSAAAKAFIEHVDSRVINIIWKRIIITRI